MNALAITPEGSQAAENVQGRGPEFAVLSMLYEADGPVDFEEIMDETHMDDEKCSMICRKLINQGRAREV